jgi:hypothetical protein
MLHLVLGATVGAMALVCPHALLVYAADAQATACAGCDLAFDLARAFGILNLLTGLLAGRFLVAARFGRDYGTADAVAHGRVLLSPLALSMLLSVMLRIYFLASGRFAAAEWLSAVVAGLMGALYWGASRRAPFASALGDR